jgi:hypothetical protein
MKTKTFAALIALELLTGCQDLSKSVFPENNSEAMSVLLDKTDEMSKPKSDDILKLYNISDDKKYDGFLLRCRPISDVSLEPVEQFQVKPETWINADDVERVQEIKEFQTSFSQWYVGANKPINKPKTHSVIYRTLADEANRMADLKTVKVRKILVCSDLAEHSNDLDLYNPRDIQLVQNKPQLVIDRFEKLVPIKSLKGITVYFVFHPQNYNQQQQYDIASKFFKMLLEEKGAVVIVGANVLAEDEH